MNSPALSSPKPASGLAETAGRFEAECAELDRFVAQLLDDVEYMALELAEKSRVLDRQQQLLTEREQELTEQRRAGERLSHQFEQQEARLAEVLLELKALRDIAAGRGTSRRA